MGKGKRMLAMALSIAFAVTALGCGSTSEEKKENGSSGAAMQTPASLEETAAGQEQTEEGSSVTSMGRYMESSFELPEDARTLARTMSLLEDGRLAYFDQEAGLYFSEDEGKSWKEHRGMRELISDREIGYVDSAAVGPDGSIALCEIFFEENVVSERKVTWLDAAGNRGETDGMSADGDWISKAAFGKDGRLYAASLHGTVYEIDRTSGEKKLLFKGAQRPEVLAFTGKLLLTLEESGVEIYNLETGALQESDPVLDDFCREKLTGKLGNNSDCVGGYLLGAEEGIVYLACSDGLFRHVLGGNALEQLIEGDFSTFGDPSVGICDVILLENGEFLLLNTGTELIRFTYDPNEPTIPEKQLKVYSLEESSRLRQAISAYQKQYPDVYVSYEIGIAQGSAVTEMDALKNLNLSMMSGNGPDVLLLDGIDQTPYVEKGMLKDLSGVLEGLTGEDAVFEHIAGAYRTEERTFVIPAGFMLPLITGKAADIDSVTDLATLADLTERLSEGLENSTVTGAMTAQQELAQLFAVCSPSWMSKKKLNETALAEFLTQAKRMYDADMAGITPDILERFSNDDGGARSIGSRVTEMMVNMGKIAFGNAKMMLLDMGSIAHFVEEEEGYSFKLWSGQCGTGFVPANKLAVSAQTVRSEEAESFVRFMLSKQVQSVALGDCFPVNRAAFDALCVWNEQSVGGSFHGPDGEVRFGNGWPKEETSGRFKELVEQADQPLEGNAVVEEAVLKYGPLVLSGSMTVEEAVQQIKKEVSIYLSEQG